MFLQSNPPIDNPATLASTNCIVQSATLATWHFADGAEVAVRWCFSAGNVYIARYIGVNSPLCFSYPPRELIGFAPVQLTMKAIATRHASPSIGQQRFAVNWVFVLTILS